jgi:hypothetical protein
MTSPCNVRRALAEKFAVAVRMYAESAVSLATSGESGSDFTRLLNQTIEAERLSELTFTAFREHVASHQCAEAARYGSPHLNAKEQERP